MTTLTTKFGLVALAALLSVTAVRAQGPAPSGDPETDALAWIAYASATRDGASSTRDAVSQGMGDLKFARLTAQNRAINLVNANSGTDAYYYVMDLLSGAEAALDTVRSAINSGNVSYALGETALFLGMDYYYTAEYNTSIYASSISVQPFRDADSAYRGAYDYLQYAQDNIQEANDFMDFVLGM